MAFDPNEPRDAFGRWTDSISSATKKAASDKPIDHAIDEYLTKNDKLWSQKKSIASLLNVPTDHIKINGLTPAEATDLQEVLANITNNGKIPVPIDHIDVCAQSGTFAEADFECLTEVGAGAWFSYDFGDNPQDAKGWLHINPGNIHNDFSYQEKPETYDEKIAQLDRMIKNMYDPTWIAGHNLSFDMHKAVDGIVAKSKQYYHNFYGF